MWQYTNRNPMNKSVGDCTVRAICTAMDTVSDLKILAETVNVLSTIKDKPMDYMDYFLQASSAGFGYKPTTVSDLKGDEQNGC